jgi:putative transposase
MRNSPHQSRLRIGRHSIPGQVYHVTIATRGRIAFFADLRNARTTVLTLRAASDLGDAETLAYVLMPEHLHWLMTLGSHRPLHRVVHAFKSVSAHRVGQPVWQRGFHDHALRSDEDCVAAARYIIANPVRRGLVERAGDYPHWDAVWL